jgi:hypothetical protein
MQDRINEKLDFQSYNGMRPQLVIPEYGRNIQKMVRYAMTLEDREERNKCVRAIISVMGQLFPHLRDIEDFNHKLWDHLQIMSAFQLDADSPYPKPDAAQLGSRPERMDYPQKEIRFGHYGHYVESMIRKCAEMEEGEEKKAFSLTIANVMKYNATNWNRNIVHDDVILKDLAYLSKGRIQLEEETHLQNVKPINAGGFKEYDTMRFSKNNKFKNNKHKNKNNKNKRKF